MKQKYIKFLVVALVLAVAVPQIAMAAWWNPFSWNIWQKIASIFNFQRAEQAQQEPVACTEEAKQCPDGSYVGRVAPNCDFAPCPEQLVVGGDRDEHGCIGSAGYSWCEAKQKCLRSWEEACE